MAAQRVFPIIMIWQIKAYLESVARSLDTLEETKKVRVNTISNHQQLQRQVKLLKALMVSLHLLIKWHR
jgi:hypothetical protein